MPMNRKSMLLIGILLSILTISAQDNSTQDSLPAEVMNASIPNPNGNDFRLAESKGEIRIILLWASWCGPCRVAVEELNKVSRAYARRKVEIIGLSVDDPAEDKEAFAAFIRSTKIRFKIGWPDEKLAKAILADHTLIPQILVLTTDGRVVKRLVGYNPNRSLAHLKEAVNQSLVRRNKEE
jgi:thiol-disulfide isomerase/thioredoxin